MFKQCTLDILNMRAILFVSFLSKLVKFNRLKIYELLGRILRESFRDQFYIKGSNGEESGFQPLNSLKLYSWI